MGEHELLARVGDVEPVVAGQPGGGEHLADRGGQSQLVEVEPAVEVAQTELVGLALVQGGTQRRPDARADQADEIAVAR